jgi:hypothetical protein
MKTIWFTTLFAALLTVSLPAQDVDPADSTGLPGDHFDLKGALELFKKAESPEEFEKLLNQEDNGVNNLDLNSDDRTDYIRVIDRMDGDVHAIVLQAPIDASEQQDVAVIEIEKTGAESAMLQIVGDEDLYGEPVIAEPTEEETRKGGRGGPSVHLAPDMIVVNVWGWPTVRFVYRPAYVAYVSPWRFGLYPTWYRPFRPHPWRVFYARPRPYRAHYHVVGTHRVVRAHHVYTPHRTHSKVVHTRTVTHVGKHGRVNATKTTKTTKVTGPRGGTVTKTQKTTRVRGGRGRH